jgi:hypothetical protein
VVAAFATDVRRALYVARTINLLECLVLVALGLRLLGSKPAVMLGAGLALTPMALFSFGTYSSSGPEIAAAFCHVAALLRLRRSEETPPELWPVLLTSGVVLTTTRSLGPGWLALLDMGFIVVVGWSTVRRLVVAGGRWGRAYLPVVVTASATTFAWQLLVQPRPPQKARLIGEFVTRAWLDLGYQYRQQVGVLGWRDVMLPHGAYRLWTVVLLALLASAVVLSRRGWLLVGVHALICIGAMMVITVFVAYPIGGSSQGRWTLPFAISLPLVAGELIAQDSKRCPRFRRWSPAIGLSLLAAVHVVAFWTAARRNAVGVGGPVQFLTHSLWSPPLGWMVVLVLMGGATGAMLAAGLLAPGEGSS